MMTNLRQLLEQFNTHSIMVDEHNLKFTSKGEVYNRDHFECMARNINHVQNKVDAIAATIRAYIFRNMDVNDEFVGELNNKVINYLISDFHDCEFLTVNCIGTELTVTHDSGLFIEYDLKGLIHSTRKLSENVTPEIAFDRFVAFKKLSVLKKHIDLMHLNDGVKLCNPG